MKHKELRNNFRWKSMLFKNGKKRKKPKILFLKDLNKSHIKLIIKYLNDKIDKIINYNEKQDKNDIIFINKMKANLILKYDNYVEIMKNELKFRNDNK